MSPAPAKAPTVASTAKPTKKQLAADPIQKLKDRLVRGERLTEEELVQLEQASVARYADLADDSKRGDKGGSSSSSSSKGLPLPLKPEAAPAPADSGRADALVQKMSIGMSTIGMSANEKELQELRELKELREAAQRERVTLDQRAAELKRLRELRAQVSRDPSAALELSSRRFSAPAPARFTDVCGTSAASSSAGAGAASSSAGAGAASSSLASSGMSLGGGSGGSGGNTGSSRSMSGLLGSCSFLVPSGMSRSSSGAGRGGGGAALPFSSSSDGVALPFASSSDNGAADYKAAAERAERAAAQAVAAVNSIQQELRYALAANHAKVLDLFRQWDSDGDGTVRKAELRKAVALLGYDVPNVEVDKLFESFDRDGGGAIEYKELQRVIRRQAEAEERNGGRNGGLTTPGGAPFILGRPQPAAPHTPALASADPSDEALDELAAAEDEEAAAAIYAGMSLEAPIAAPAAAAVAADTSKASCRSQESTKGAKGGAKASGPAAVARQASGTKPADPIAVRDAAVRDLLALVETAAPWAYWHARLSLDQLPEALLTSTAFDTEEGAVVGATSNAAGASAAASTGAVRKLTLPPTGHAFADAASMLALVGGFVSVGVLSGPLIGFGAPLLVSAPSAAPSAAPSTAAALLTLTALWPLHLAMAMAACGLLITLARQLIARALLGSRRAQQQQQQQQQQQSRPLLPLTAPRSDGSGANGTPWLGDSVRLADWSALAAVECLLAAYLAAWGVPLGQPLGQLTGQLPGASEHGAGPVGNGTLTGTGAMGAPLPELLATGCAATLLMCAALRALQMIHWRLEVGGWCRWATFASAIPSASESSSAVSAAAKVAPAATTSGAKADAKGAKGTGAPPAPSAPLSSLRLCPPGCATAFTSCIEWLKSRVAGGGKPAAVAKAGAKAGAKPSAKAVSTPAKPAPPKATPAKKGAGPKAMV